MHRAGDIPELFLDHTILRRRIRSITPEGSEPLFNGLILHTIFQRRITTDPAFRWSICTTIASDAETSEMLRCAIIDTMSDRKEHTEQSAYKIPTITDCQNTICTLFSDETALPLHYWETKWAGMIYQTIAYPTAIQTSPPEKQELFHPMDRAIISVFMQEKDAETFSKNNEDLSASDLLTDAITDVAYRWFLALSYDEQLSILNKTYPEDGWTPLIQTLSMFEQSTDALIDGARYCSATHLIEAARELYSYALTRTEDPVKKQICYKEMGLLSRNLGDAERAFPEFQSALEAAREVKGSNAESFNDELIYLCEAADRLDLTQEGNGMYDRLIRIAHNLYGEERRRLLIQIATSCRRSGWFDREYAIIEELIGEEDLNNTVLSRLDTLNRAMQRDGTLNLALLKDLEAGAEAEYTLIRGILAFGAFQFNDALTWFQRSVTLKNRPDTRLWIARASWYADVRDAPLSAGKDDLLETRIIRTLLETKSIQDATEVLIADGKEDGEEYDGLLILLEAMRGDDLSHWIQALTESIQKAPIAQNKKTYLLRITGKVLSECGIKTAIILFRKALKITTDKESRAQLLSEIAYWHESQGQITRALDAYNHAVSIVKKFPGAWYGLARTHAQNGDFDEAVESIDTALGLMPENEEYHLLKRDLSMLKATQDLDPERKQQIDTLDRDLFIWGDQVPERFIRRYENLITSDTDEGLAERSDHAGVVMRSRGEIIWVRNNVLHNLITLKR